VHLADGCNADIVCVRVRGVHGTLVIGCDADIGSVRDLAFECSEGRLC
jgi:hypothetical protein